MLTLGIIGLGHIARTHLAAAEKIPEVQIVAATRSRSADATLERYPMLRIHDRPEDLLQDPALDGVFVCVPTFLHEKYVTAAARSGKHILCEKPFALDDGAAERMLDEVRKAGVTFMVAQVLRFWPEYLRLREFVLTGRIGTLQAASAWRLAAYPVWGEWFRDPEKSGGCLLDLQVHDIDFVHWLLGTPRTVYARGLKSAAGSWDHVVTTLGYRDAVASIEASYLMPPGWPFRMGFRASGSAGAIEYDWRVVGNIAERADAQQSLFLFDAEGVRSEVAVAGSDPYVEQLRYFARQAKTGRAPDVCRPEESLTVMRVMSACQRSAETGAPVSLHEG